MRVPKFPPWVQITLQVLFTAYHGIHTAGLLPSDDAWKALGIFVASAQMVLFVNGLYTPPPAVKEK